MHVWKLLFIHIVASSFPSVSSLALLSGAPALSFTHSLGCPVCSPVSTSPPPTQTSLPGSTCLTKRLLSISISSTHTCVVANTSVTTFTISLHLPRHLLRSYILSPLSPRRGAAHGEGGVELGWVGWCGISWQEFGMRIEDHRAASGRQPSILSQVTAESWHSSPDQAGRKSINQSVDPAGSDLCSWAWDCGSTRG